MELKVILDAKRNGYAINTIMEILLFSIG